MRLASQADWYNSLAHHKMLPSKFCSYQSIKQHLFLQVHKEDVSFGRMSSEKEIAATLIDCFACEILKT